MVKCVILRIINVFLIKSLIWYLKSVFKIFYFFKIHFFIILNYFNISILKIIFKNKKIYFNIYIYIYIYIFKKKKYSEPNPVRKYL
jgi:hypothetical protein